MKPLEGFGKMLGGLKVLRDQLAVEAHGMTIDQAHAAGICLSCKQPPAFKTDLGRDEYRISGLCEACFKASAEPEPR